MLEYWYQPGHSGSNAGTEANPFSDWTTCRADAVPDTDGKALIHCAGTTRFYDTATGTDLGVTGFQFAEEGTFYLRNTSATPARFTGRFDLSEALPAAGIAIARNTDSPNDDVWNIDGFDVTEGSAGNILRLLAIDYTTRRHLLTGQPYALCPRRSSIPEVVGFAASGLGAVSITRTSNVATVTTPANHGLRTGDYWTTSDAADATLEVTRATITVTGATTFTYASTGSDVGATAGEGFLDESGFYYDEANDLIYARARGSNGVKPDLIEGVWGGGGVDYNGLSAGANQTIYVQGNIQVDCICPRSSNDGNPLLATGGGKIIVQAYGGYEPEFWDGGDHVAYSAGDDAGGIRFDAGKCGGTASHVGDSIIVGYIANTSGSDDYEDLSVSRPSMVAQSISLGFDALDTDDPLPADKGNTYSGALVGITSHTNRPLAQHVSRFRYDGFTLRCNPRSFNRSNAIRGFTAAGTALSVRDVTQPLGPLSGPSALPGVFTNFAVLDAVALDLGTVRQGMAFAGTWEYHAQGCDAFSGGRGDVGTNYNSSNGAVGHITQATESRTLLYGGIATCNAHANTSTTVYKANRSATAANACRDTHVRWERSALLCNGYYNSGTNKLIDIGTAFTGLNLVNLAADGSLGASDAAICASVRAFVDFLSCHTEFIDTHVGYVGRSTSTSIKMLGNLASQSYNLRQLRQAIAISGGYFWGVTASAYANTGENINYLSTAAGWTSDAMTPSSATRSGTTVTYTMSTQHPIKVNSVVRVEGSTDADGLHTVTATASGLTFAFTDSGGAGAIAAPGTVYTGVVFAPGATVGTNPGYGTLCWAVTAASRVGNLVTVTAANHGVAAGDRIATQGITPHCFSGCFVAESVTNTTISYRVGYSGTTTGTVDGTHGQVTKLPRRPLASAMRARDPLLDGTAKRAMLIPMLIS